MGLLRMAAAAGAGLAASATYSFSPRSTPAEAHALGEGEGAPAERHRVVVVGGGAAGLTVAAQFTRKLGQAADVAVVEPSGFHYYQPWWTMAGGGLVSVEDSRREMGAVMPAGVRWIKERAASFRPDANAVLMEGGKKLEYEYLVVATGIKVDLNSIKGLADTVGKNGVSTIYSYDYAGRVWELIRELKQGKAIFTMPNTPVKCGGAPQKIMWLAEDFWRSQGPEVRDNIEVNYMTGIGAMFPVKKYGDTLQQMTADRGVVPFYQHDLVEVDGPKQVATFQTPDGKTIKKDFDLLHVVPRMGPHDFVRKSPIADPTTGYVTVDKGTLQHTKYPNIFALGDCSNLPTSKTAAAVSAQAPVLVHNLTRAMVGKAPNAAYDGYTSCPILTKRGGLVLAEFMYGGEPKETFGGLLDQGAERLPFYYLKKYVFPWAYWNAMLQGRWYGPRTFFAPTFPDEE
eukprot:jgi/Tetstr1/445974/TSEL_003531.t1